jgi:hypothetical protein
MRLAVELGLIVLAFLSGRLWQWVKDARGAMGSRSGKPRR